jgi:hypothetical protein
MALVESTFSGTVPDAGTSPEAGAPQPEQAPIIPAPVGSATQPSVPGVRTVAEEKEPGPASLTAPVAGDRSATPIKEADAVPDVPSAAPESLSQPSATHPGLTLQQVQRSWDAVLHAVRQRNPATQAVLNTGCQPVEVSDKEIVVTFPYPFLREKLGDPQRRTEIQDALAEVLHARCRLKLVLASEYTPRRPPNPRPTGPASLSTVSVESGPVESGPVENGPVESGPVETSAAEVGPVEPAPDAEAEEDEVPEVISRWAAERGGRARFVPG